jgi:hypothetical protein
MEDQLDAERAAAMKPLVLVAIVALSLGAGACGHATSSANYIRSDEDGSGDDIRGENDNEGVEDYGHQANATDRQAITTLVKRYYAAAAAGNGSVACSLISPQIADSRSFVKLVPKEYVPASGTATLAGKDCAQVESLLFRIDHQQLATSIASLQVTRVRIDGNNGWALLGFRTMGEHQFPVVREGDGWKIRAMFDEEIR